MTSQKTGGLKPSRRTLVKGAAWSVPVVAVAGAAPALAASPCIEFSFSGTSCKNPGNTDGGKLYKLDWCVEVTCRLPDGSRPTEIYIHDANNASKPLVPQTCSYPIKITLDENGMGCSGVDCIYKSESSANQIFVYWSFYADGTGATWTTEPIPAPPTHEDCAVLP